MERPDKDKLSHAAVGYQVTSTHAGQHCDNCVHVIEAGDGTRCESVRGPIYLAGWCKRWAKRKKS